MASKPWNFCPWCSHRIYQHSDSGCLHEDRKVRHCSDPQCGDSDYDHDCGYSAEDVACDCDMGHWILEMIGCA